MMKLCAVSRDFNQRRKDISHKFLMDPGYWKWWIFAPPLVVGNIWSMLKP